MITFGPPPQSYFGQLGQHCNSNLPRCECHECTQARWKTSFHGQFDQALKVQGSAVGQGPRTDSHTDTEA